MLENIPYWRKRLVQLSNYRQFFTLHYVTHIYRPLTRNRLLQSYIHIYCSHFWCFPCKSKLLAINLSIEETFKKSFTISLRAWNNRSKIYYRFAFWNVTWRYFQPSKLWSGNFIFYSSYQGDTEFFFLLLNMRVSH